jgi:hypothetical protein
MLQYELNYDHLMLFIYGYWHYDFTKFLSFTGKYYMIINN